MTPRAHGRPASSFTGRKMSRKEGLIVDIGGNMLLFITILQLVVGNQNSPLMRAVSCEVRTRERRLQRRRLPLGVNHAVCGYWGVLPIRSEGATQPPPRNAAPQRHSHC